jgi:hypothetical protein
MECLYLEVGKRSNLCNVSVTLMAPSIYEMNRYCTTDNYDQCAIFLAHILRGEHRGDGKGMCIVQNNIEEGDFI